MDTAEPTVLPPPPGGPPAEPDAEVAPGRRPWSARRKWFFFIWMAVLAAVASAGFLWKLPYYTLSPGSARDT